MKVCKCCNKELEDSKFYFYNFYRKSGKKALSSYCRSCDSLRANPGRKKDYKPQSGKKQFKDVREEINVDCKQIYLLIRKIEISGFRMNVIDSFRLVSLYTDIFGDDIEDFYGEKEQLDIMFYKLKDFIKKQDQPMVI